MILYTAYAEKKFNILSRHGCVISREFVLDVMRDAAHSAAKKKGTLFFTQKKWKEAYAIRVVYKKERGVVRIITFYPIKENEYE